jgi:hypothetical protein
MKHVFTANDEVLPWPVERLSEYAHAKARRTFDEKLMATFHHSEAAANAVVDPSEVCKSLGDPSDHQVTPVASVGANDTAHIDDTDENDEIDKEAYIAALLDVMPLRLMMRTNAPARVGRTEL